MGTVYVIVEYDRSDMDELWVSVVRVCATLEAAESWLTGLGYVKIDDNEHDCYYEDVEADCQYTIKTFPVLT